MTEIYSKKSDNMWFAVALNNQKIVTCSFGEIQQATINSLLNHIPHKTQIQVFVEPPVFAATALDTLIDIYNGRSINTNLPLATDGFTAYTKKVLRTTQAIPLGYVSSYGAIADAAGGGARAVGNIMASNPFAPIVPCHRVVKSDFSLGGYGLGGLKIKFEFLEKEQRGFSKAVTVEVEGGTLSVFPVEWVIRNLLNLLRK